MENDVRTIEKLVNGINETINDKNMWLTPLVHSNTGDGFPDNSISEKNQIIISFDRPIAIASICIWNYTKTPERGVHEFAIYFDDILIYMVKKILNFQ